MVMGTQVKAARHSAGMTQAELARATGVSERNIVRWENNQHTPRAEALAAIARATGQDIEFFYASESEEAAPLGGRFRNGGSAGGPGRADRGKRPSPDSGSEVAA